MDEPRNEDRAARATQSAIARLTIENQILLEDNVALGQTVRRQSETINSLQDVLERMTKGGTDDTEKGEGSKTA